MAQSRLQNRNVNTGTKRTSMRLEPEIWDAMREVCKREGINEREVIRRAQVAYNSIKLTSAVRTFLLEYFRSALAGLAVAPAEHRLAGPESHDFAPQVALDGGIRDGASIG